MAKRYLPKFYEDVSKTKLAFIKSNLDFIKISHDAELVYRIQCYLGVTNDIAQKIIESYFETISENLLNNSSFLTSLGKLQPSAANNKINVDFKSIKINN